MRRQGLEFESWSTCATWGQYSRGVAVHESGAYDGAAPGRGRYLGRAYCESSVTSAPCSTLAPVASGLPSAGSMDTSMFSNSRREPRPCTIIWP